MKAVSEKNEGYRAISGSGWKSKGLWLMSARTGEQLKEVHMGVITLGKKMNATLSSKKINVSMKLLF